MTTRDPGSGRGTARRRPGAAVVPSPVLAGVLAVAALAWGCDARSGEARSGDAASRGDAPFRERRIRVGPSPVSVLATDVNRDGHTDVAASGGMGVVVLVGDGAGGLDGREPVDAGPGSQGLTAGDFDADGWPDLAVANHETDHVTVLFGGPDGFTAGRQRRITVETSPHPHEVKALDADGDGRLDLLVDDRSAGAFHLLRGGGDGTFTRGGTVDVGGDPYLRTAVADLDGDGTLDLATPNPGSVALHLGDGAGGFRRGPELHAPGLRPFGVAVGDVNADGAPDLLAGDAGEGGRGRFAIWVGTGYGAWVLDDDAPWVAAGGPSEVALADVDGDGRDDAVVTSYVGSELAVLLSGAPGAGPTRIPVRDNPWGVAAADLDGDGRAEIVTANNGGDELSVFDRPGG